MMTEEREKTNRINERDMTRGRRKQNIKSQRKDKAGNSKRADSRSGG